MQVQTGMTIRFAAVLLLAQLWWAFILRGVLGIVFGVVVILFPAIGLIAVVALFAAWALVGGVSSLVGAWRSRGQKDWWVGVLEGLAGIAAGIVVILLPPAAALALLFVIAAWAILTGVLQIWMAVRLREQISGELWMGLSGLVSILFGLFLIIFPGTGILSVLLLVGIFSILMGVAMLLLGWRLRGIHGQAKRQDEYAERGLPG
jgi:uncharacterized membrane protein HdeD (DUF308 family)